MNEQPDDRTLPSPPAALIGLVLILTVVLAIAFLVAAATVHTL